MIIIIIQICFSLFDREKVWVECEFINYNTVYNEYEFVYVLKYEYVCKLSLIEKKIQEHKKDKKE